MYRIWRYPSSEFGIFSSKLDDLQDETVTAENAYSDDNLAEIAANCEIISDELENVKYILPCVSRDSRQGVHRSA